jgi:Icc-related predicted phosphoesterase
MKIWHISDTHGLHDKLVPPKDVDMVIHSGDASNYRDPYRNESEMHSFLTWFHNLNIENKIFVAGNHDSSIEKGLIHPSDMENLGIRYIFMETVEISGFKIWGSPFVPRFGDWSFMKSRAKMMDKVWDFMDDQADIIVTHTPPKGILDITESIIEDKMLGVKHRILENVGCESLRKKIFSNKPKLHCFGHIHGEKNAYNSGTRTVAGMDTVFSNGSCCENGHKERLRNNGNVIILNAE